MPCLINCSFTCKAAEGASAGGPLVDKALRLVLVLAACASTVFIGGLGALQDECGFSYPDGFTGIYGFSPEALSCKTIYRYYWFIVVFNYVAIGIAAYAIVGGQLERYRMSIMGLFVLATLLMMYTSDAFLTILDKPVFQAGTLKDRSKTAVAGAIMTATFNAIVVALSGVTA